MTRTDDIHAKRDLNLRFNVGATIGRPLIQTLAQIQYIISHNNIKVKGLEIFFESANIACAHENDTVVVTRP